VSTLVKVLMGPERAAKFQVRSYPSNSCYYHISHGLFCYEYTKGVFVVVGGGGSGVRGDTSSHQ